jgi:hypothetical protein
MRTESDNRTIIRRHQRGRYSSRWPFFQLGMLRYHGWLVAYGDVAPVNFHSIMDKDHGPSTKDARTRGRKGFPIVPDGSPLSWDDTGRKWTTEVRGMCLSTLFDGC